ncbi:MAG TPA: hypothetical protein VNE82_22690 [Candidatus Binataceae bacterium]|nr:hypothetical protein [Candidatus Binataceae bacterium]
MSFVTKCYIQARESLLGHGRAQTMAEYALIIATVVVAVYGLYQSMGTDISSIAHSADNPLLTNA